VTLRYEQDSYQNQGNAPSSVHNQSCLHQLFVSLKL
jgi:hypothetical protein